MNLESLVLPKGAVLLKDMDDDRSKVTAYLLALYPHIVAGLTGASSRGPALGFAERVRSRLGCRGRAREHHQQERVRDGAATLSFRENRKSSG
jgi:hypothetical protein